MSTHQIFLIVGLIFIVTSIVFGVMHHIELRNKERTGSMSLSLYESETALIGITCLILGCFFKK